MHRFFLSQLFILSGLLLLLSCQKSDKKDSEPGLPQDKGKVLLDTRMVQLLFPPGKDILTGGDGAISIPIDSTKSFWLWGDSFLGEVVDNKREGSTPFIAGNVWQLLNGESVRTIMGGTSANPGPFLKTENVDDSPALLWPMHGFVENSIVHVFMSTIVKTGPGSWDFYWDSTIYYRLNLSDLSVIDKQQLFTGTEANAHFGFGATYHDGFYYIYGSSQQEDFSAPLHVARARLRDDKLGEWEFFNGNEWASHPSESKPLHGIDIPVSEQFSLFIHNNKFILLTQDRFQPEIYTFTADTPVGPWSYKKHIYTIPEGNDTTLFTYNAMAHPQYGENDQLLVSYCVNAKNIGDLYRDASIYRPRFFWISLDTFLDDGNL